MLRMFESYLSNRTFVVRVRSVLSKLQENGVPLGGVLSRTFFIVLMNRLGKHCSNNLLLRVYIRRADFFQVL